MTEQNTDRELKRFPGTWWLVLIASLILAAHFSRNDQIIPEIVSVLMPFLLLTKKKWSWLVLSVFLSIGGIVWIFTIYNMAMLRLETGQPWLRMALILGSIVLFTFYSAFKAYRYQEKFEESESK